MAESAHYCLEEVRRFDHDRFLTALFAPGDKRDALFALYAFNSEIAKVRELVSEPMLGEIRLQWWRETIEALDQGEVRGHEVAAALAPLVASGTIEIKPLIALIDARATDLHGQPIADMADLIAYARQTGAGPMRIAARLLGGTDKAETIEAIINDAGTAYALTGLMRALPFHASRGQTFLPRDLLSGHKIALEDLFGGRATPGLTQAISTVLDEAGKHLNRARGARVSRTLLPALLPAALIDRPMAQMRSPEFDPFRDSTEVPAYRRQIRLLYRAVTGRF